MNVKWQYTSSNTDPDNYKSADKATCCRKCIICICLPYLISSWGERERIKSPANVTVFIDTVWIDFLSNICFQNLGFHKFLLQNVYRMLYHNIYKAWLWRYLFLSIHSVSK